MSPVQTVESLYLEFFPLLQGWCQKKLRDNDAAHEIAQEAFVKLLDHLQHRTGEDIENPRAFLFHVARNLIIDHLRRADRQGGGFFPNDARRVSGLTALDEDGEERTIDVAHHGWFEAKGKVDWHALGKHMAVLTPRQRHLLELRYREGMPPALIALVYRITPNLVSVELNRAKARLKASMARGTPFALPPGSPDESKGKRIRPYAAPGAGFFPGNALQALSPAARKRAYKARCDAKKRAKRAKKAQEGK